MRRDEGNAIVEFALWVPIVLIALCSCLQLMSVLYTQRAADAAAERAVLAQRNGGDPVAAARSDLPEEAVVSVTNGSVTVDLTAQQYVILLPKRFVEVSATQSVPEVQP